MSVACQGLPSIRRVVCTFARLTILADAHLIYIFNAIVINHECVSLGYHVFQKDISITTVSTRNVCALHPAHSHTHTHTHDTSPMNGCACCGCCFICARSVQQQICQCVVVVVVIVNVCVCVFRFAYIRLFFHVRFVSHRRLHVAPMLLNCDVSACN